MSASLLSKSDPTVFTVDKNVPLEPPKSGVRRYPFSTMEVGDSFFVPVGEGNSQANVISAALSRAKHGHPGFRITSRKVEGGWRFWRTA